MSILSFMSILYIITQADGGGAQKYVLALAKHFKGAIAAGSEAQKLFDDARNLQLTTYNLQHLRRSIHPWHDLVAMWEIRQLIRVLKPSVVHLNSTKAGVLGSFAAIGLKTKIVFTAHGFRFLEPLSNASKSFYLALEKTASAYRDFIITVSDADKKAALDNKLIAENKIQTIHNGLPKLQFLEKQEARKKLLLPENKILLGCVANFYKTKGLDILVDAISLLDDKIKNNIHLSIIGRSNHARDEVRSKILEYELGEKITLIDSLPMAYPYLSAFDVFILPSRKEGFPLVLLEAMQAGLPIVATKVGGIPEALEDGGLQVAPEDPKALADAIQLLINDKNLASQFSQRAKQRSELFSEEKMLSETEKIYQKLLS